MIECVLENSIPEPKLHIEWGNSIPPEIMIAMKNGETVMLHDGHGLPYALLLMDNFGTIREKIVSI